MPFYNVPAYIIVYQFKFVTNPGDKVSLHKKIKQNYTEGSSINKSSLLIFISFCISRVVTGRYETDRHVEDNRSIFANSQVNNQQIIDLTVKSRYFT